MDKEVHNLLFDVRRSVRYHDRREGFFSFLRNATDFGVFVLGSTTVLMLAEAVGADWPIVAKLTIPLIATLLTGGALVGQVATKSALHNSLKRQFIALEQKLVKHRKSMTEEMLSEFQQERLIIEKDERPILRVLDTICYNETVWAMGYKESHLKKVTRVQKFMAQFRDIDPDGTRASVTS